MFRPEDKVMQITYSVGMLIAIFLAIIGFLVILSIVFRYL
tara:strand:- start:709 stop:828 length:120 start_codon:yes stop_codon:yes gene_type:complete